MQFTKEIAGVANITLTSAQKYAKMIIRNWIASTGNCTFTGTAVFRGSLGASSAITLFPGDEISLHDPIDGIQGTIAVASGCTIDLILIDN